MTFLAIKPQQYQYLWNGLKVELKITKTKSYRVISVVGLRQLKKLTGDEQQYMQSLIKRKIIGKSKIKTWIDVRHRNLIKHQINLFQYTTYSRADPCYYVKNKTKKKVT